MNKLHAVIWFCMGAATTLTALTVHQNYLMMKEMEASTRQLNQIYKDMPEMAAIPSDETEIAGETVCVKQNDPKTHQWIKKSCVGPASGASVEMITTGENSGNVVTFNYQGK